MLAHTSRTAAVARVEHQEGTPSLCVSTIRSKPVVCELRPICYKGEEITLSEWIIALVSGTVGVVLGVVITEILAWRRESAKVAKQRNAIYRMLGIEMAKNREVLRSFLTTPEENLPVQSNQIWENVLKSIAVVLRSDEIKNAHDFYYDLYCLRRLPKPKRSSTQGASWELPDELKKGIEDFLKKHNNPLPMQQAVPGI
jgi:hypothetical protein